ncbi:MAG TPA: transaldolase, partial [Longimicrobiaceae bacterium]|nr:transaldolase [Longimicrobiaceae bacterium]
SKHPTDAVEQNGRNPLHELHGLGQSVWLDYIRRGILDNGELERMIRDYDLRGITSNPSIFEQAIGDSTDYDEELERLAGEGLGGEAAYERLAVSDIQRAADLFRGVYGGSGGTDGFVSLEVSPELAHDTEGTLDDARRLWKWVDRPNVMIKVPGTEAGLPAIEQLLSEGINVNVTLLFSLGGYERVMEAFLRGIERRVDAGQPVDRVASVASFFVSRVDSAVDGQLGKIAEGDADEERKKQAKSLLGRAAIDNAKVAYARFGETFGGERWARLKAAGAQIQRPLWASTSTKNPDYRDVIYVEELVGPDTVNTMPLATVEAFADHGVAKRTVDRELDRAREELAVLKSLGIDLDAVTEQLQVEGVDKFAKSFREMLATVGEKVGRVAGRA